jgi:hypothetical protein
MNDCLFCGGNARKKFCDDTCKARYYQKKRLDRINKLDPDKHIDEILNDEGYLGKFYRLKAIIRSLQRKIEKQEKIIEYLSDKAYSKGTIPNVYSNSRIKSKGRCCMASRTTHRTVKNEE